MIDSNFFKTSWDRASFPPELRPFCFAMVVFDLQHAKEKRRDSIIISKSVSYGRHCQFTWPIIVCFFF